MRNLIVSIFFISLLGACNQTEPLEPACEIGKGQIRASARVKKGDKYCLGGYILKLEDNTKLSVVVDWPGPGSQKLDVGQMDEWVASREWVEVVYYTDTTLYDQLAVVDIACDNPFAVPDHASDYVRIACINGTPLEEE